MIDPTLQTCQKLPSAVSVKSSMELDMEVLRWQEWGPSYPVCKEPTLPEVGASWMSRGDCSPEGSADGTASKVGCGAGASPEPSVGSGRRARGGVLSVVAWSWAGGGSWSGVTSVEEVEGVGDCRAWAARSWSWPSECGSEYVWGSVSFLVSGEPGIKSV